jgi:hypothetical protein
MVLIEAVTSISAVGEIGVLIWFNGCILLSRTL